MAFDPVIGIERCDIQAANTLGYETEVLLLLDADWAMPSFASVERFKDYCREWHGDKISDDAVKAIYEAAILADPTRP